MLGGLYLAQGWVADWLTDDEIIDENDIVAALDETVAPSAADSCEPWIVTFADEFDGDSVDTDSWLVYNSAAANGNGTRTPDAVEVVDGNLVITAQMTDGELILGGVASNHQQSYGRVEARVRTELDPSGTLTGLVGTWPAGNDHPDAGAFTFYQTPPDGERLPFYSYLVDTQGTVEEIIHRVNAQDWHDVAIEWSEGHVTVYRDDAAVGFADAPTIPDQPHVLTMQLSAATPVMEQANDSVVRLFVDWVRFQQANETPGPDC